MYVPNVVMYFDGRRPAAGCSGGNFLSLEVKLVAKGY